MRKQLQRFVTLTREYTATVDTICYNGIIHSRLSCIVNVETNNNIVSDHCWINISNLPRKYFKKGNKIKFTAKVESYYKNGQDGEKIKDYCLTNISNISLV